METANGVTMEQILSDVCRRDQFTCQQCGKRMGHVDCYLVLHLVRRTREARPPGDDELQCTRCLPSGQHSLCEVVLEDAGGKYAPRTPTRERLLTLGKQVLQHSQENDTDVIEIIDRLLAEPPGEEDKRILEMMRKQMAREGQ
jgi:hypothetical protein